MFLKGKLYCSILVKFTSWILAQNSAILWPAPQEMERGGRWYLERGFWKGIVFIVNSYFIPINPAYYTINFLFQWYWCSRNLDKIFFTQCILSTGAIFNYFYCFWFDSWILKITFVFLKWKILKYFLQK